MNDRKEWPTVALGDLIPWPGLNPRQHFDEDELEELRASIKADGLLQPIGVKANEKGPHWIFAGERRWKASQGILDEVPVFWRNIDEAAAHRLALTENIQQANLTALEEAHGIQRYIDASSKTQGDVADELGKTQGWVSNRLRLLKLHPLIQDLLEQGHMSATQARDLVLPFAGIGQDKWNELNRSVSSQLREVVVKVDRQLVDDEVRLAVSNVAMAMSGWLTVDWYDYSADAKKPWRSNIEIPEEEWKTAPSGSIVKYEYSRYSSGRKTARAFDDEWLEARMGSADARHRAETAERAGMNGHVESQKDLEWTADMGAVPAEVEIPWSQLHVVYQLIGENHYAPRTLHHAGLEYTVNADPRQIPADKLVLWEGTKTRSPQILCTDHDVFVAAKRALLDEAERLAEAKAAQQLGRDKEEAARVNLVDALPVLVASGYDYDHEHLQDAATALGLTFPEEYDSERPDDDDMPWVHRIAAWLTDLEPATHDELLSLLVVRILNIGRRTPPVTEAHQTLRAMMLGELVHLVDGRFAIPTPPEGVTAEVEGGTLEGFPEEGGELAAEPEWLGDPDVPSETDIEEGGEDVPPRFYADQDPSEAEELGEIDDDNDVLRVRYEEHLEASEAEAADQVDESEAPNLDDIF